MNCEYMCGRCDNRIVSKLDNSNFVHHFGAIVSLDPKVLAENPELEVQLFFLVFQDFHVKNICDDFHYTSNIIPLKHFRGKIGLSASLKYYNLRVSFIEYQKILKVKQ